MNLSIIFTPLFIFCFTVCQGRSEFKGLYLMSVRARYTISLYSLPIDPRSSLKNLYLCSQMRRSKKTVLNQCHYLSSADSLVTGVSESICYRKRRTSYIYSIYQRWFSKDIDGQCEFLPFANSSQKSIQVLVCLASAACSFIKMAEVSSWGVLTIRRVPYWFSKYGQCVQKSMLHMHSFEAIFNLQNP